jgi:hypothetical protein
MTCHHGIGKISGGSQHVLPLYGLSIRWRHSQEIACTVLGVIGSKTSADDVLNTENGRFFGTIGTGPELTSQLSAFF